MKYYRFMICIINLCTFICPRFLQNSNVTKFRVVYETWTTMAKFSYFHLELNSVMTYLALARF